MDGKIALGVWDWSGNTQNHIYTVVLTVNKNILTVKQEANGPDRSHENQFKSINTSEKSYDYIITLIRRRKKPISLLFEN